MAARKYCVDETFFDEIDNESKAYILGFLTTDGTVTSGYLGWQLGEKDEPHLQKINEKMGSNFPIKRVLNKRHDGYASTYGVYLRFYRPALIRSVARFGIVPGKTFTVKPADIPDELLSHYWRGCLDGDGWFVQKGNAFQVGFCGNESMVTSFRDYIRTKTGFSATVRPIRSIFRVEYSGIRGPAAIAKLLYGEAELFLDRKAEVAKKAALAVPSRRDLSSVTLTEIEKRYSEMGSWTKVAESFGLNYKDLYQIRKREERRAA